MPLLRVPPISWHNFMQNPILALWYPLFLKNTFPYEMCYLVLSHLFPPIVLKDLAVILPHLRNMQPCSCTRPCGRSFHGLSAPWGSHPSERLFSSPLPTAMLGSFASHKVTNFYRLHWLSWCWSCFILAYFLSEKFFGNTVQDFLVPAQNCLIATHRTKNIILWPSQPQTMPCGVLGYVFKSSCPTASQCTPAPQVPCSVSAHSAWACLWPHALADPLAWHSLALFCNFFSSLLKYHPLKRSLS